MRCERHPSRHDRHRPTSRFSEEVDREISSRGRRWALSHVEILSPRDVEAIARMEIVITTHTQRIFVQGHSDQADTTAAGSSVTARSIRWRSLVEAGVKVCFASDNVPCSLFMPMSQAIARVPYEFEELVALEEALSRRRGLAALCHDERRLLDI